MGQFDKLYGLGNEVEWFIREIMIGRVPKLLDLFPVNRRVITIQGDPHYFGWACHISGIACVYRDGSQELEVYGRGCNVDMLMSRWPTAKRQPEMKVFRALQASDHLLHIATDYHGDEYVADFHAANRRRISLLQIQHLVCEHHPDFRDWEASARPDTPEVVLRPLTPVGRRLGGIVWDRKTYTTREGVDSLLRPSKIS